MTDWIVRRWARYGHQRLYAETPGGTALGYLDLKSGRYHSDDVTNLPLLQRAIGDYLAGTVSNEAEAILTNSAQTVAEPPTTSRPIGPAAIAEPDSRWEDIGATAAGAAARERAIAEREAQGRARNLLARLVGAKTDERAWRIGADGEEAVAEQLSKLGPAWHVIHAIRVGNRGADIDHLLIGPPGVFTVNAKHHPHANVWAGGDTFMINGQRVPYIRNSRHEAHRAARLLTEQVGFPVTATGLIAVIGAHKGFRVKSQPEDHAVVVVSRRRIAPHLLRLTPCLTAREIEAIYEVARRSTTWH